ncbi:MAG: hypothetical protein ABIU87_01370 [Ornithinibacter sp.]
MDGESTSARLTGPNELRNRASLSAYSTIIQGGARLGFSVLVGRLGSRELLGQTNSSLSIAVLASQLGAASTAQAGVRFVSQSKTLGDDDGAARIGRHIANRLAMLALIVPTTAALVASLFLGFDSRQIIVTMVLAWAYAMYSALRGIQFGRLGFRHVAFWDTVAAGTTLLTTVLVLTLDLTDLALLPLTLGYLLFAVASWPARVASRVERDLRRTIDKFIAYGTIATIASGGLLQASQIAARYLAGSAGAGDYAAALSLATPASMLSVALSTVIVPPLVAAAGRGDRLAVRHHADLILRRLTTIFVGVFGVLILASPIGIAVFYGVAFEQSAALLPVLLLAVMLMSISLGAATALQSTQSRGPRIVAILNVAGLLVSLVTWSVLGSAYGTMGVAVGFLVGSLVTSVALVAVAWRVERQHWGDLLVRFLSGTVLFTILAVVTRDVPGVAGRVAQLCAVLFFALVWGAMMRRDVLALWRTVRGTTK